MARCESSWGTLSARPAFDSNQKCLIGHPDSETMPANRPGRASRSLYAAGRAAPTLAQSILELVCELDENARTGKVCRTRPADAAANA